MLPGMVFNGLGMALSITVLGALREILGQGTLFEGIENLFGQGAKFLTLHIYHADSSFYSLFFRQVHLLD